MVCMLVKPHAKSQARSHSQTRSNFVAGAFGEFAREAERRSLCVDAADGRSHSLLDVCQGCMYETSARTQRSPSKATPHDTPFCAVRDSVCKSIKRAPDPEELERALAHVESASDAIALHEVVGVGHSAVAFARTANLSVARDQTPTGRRRVAKQLICATVELEHKILTIGCLQFV